jgi:chromosome partitioning protein
MTTKGGALMKTRTIAIANEKGGVGKTVTAINLGAALTLNNQKVLIVDMDPQANATKGLGIGGAYDGPNIYDMLQKPKKIAPEKVIVATAWEGLDLIPSHVDLSGAEVEMVNKIGRENLLKRALQDLPQHYDFILLDTPPSLSLLTVNVFSYAKYVLVPCQTHPYAYAALEELFDTVAAVKDAINPDIDVLGIVATHYDNRTRVSQTILNQLRSDARYNGLLFDTLIRANITIAESAAAEKPVVFYRRGSFGAIDYNDLADELMHKC